MEKAKDILKDLVRVIVEHSDGQKKIFFWIRSPEADLE